MDLCRLMNRFQHLGYYCELELPSEFKSYLLNTPMDLDLRVVITWDTDMCDVVLEIEEPNGEILNSFSPLSNNGSLRSRDFATGFGPVEALFKTTILGCYNFYLKLNTPLKVEDGVNVLLAVYTNFGRTNEKMHTSVVRLYENTKTPIFVGSCEIFNT